MRLSVLPVLLLPFGCPSAPGEPAATAEVLDQTEFELAYGTMVCDLRNDCRVRAGEAEIDCAPEPGPAPRACPDFDPDHAGTCLTDLAESGCDGEHEPVLPDSCERAGAWCPWDYDSFITEFWDQFCGGGNACRETEGLDPVDCSDMGDIAPTLPAGCTFHATLAEACLGAVGAATCTGPVLPRPSLCDEVATCVEDSD